MLLTTALATLALTVAPGASGTIKAHSPIHGDVRLISVRVNGRPLNVGDTAGDRSYMYGAGVAIRFERDKRRRLTMRVASVAVTSRRILVRYRADAD